ncbi:MAG: YbaK/EbsC family protein [Clostridia bacterium]|nr:YbaK/EbsC family protein [Clostridia bacterium]
MSKEAVMEYLKKVGLAENYIEFDEDATATVALAAQAIGCEEGRIAKTMSLNTKEGPIVIVFMGTARLDNRRFKDTFAEKARFLQGDEVQELTGHPIGGVCPFALKEGVRVFLDESLRVFDYVYPAAGATNNAVKISVDKLAEVTGGTWIHVSKDLE